LSALFMTVTDRLFCSLSCYVQNFSRISAENVGSQPNFTYCNNSAKPNISLNFFLAIQNLNKFGLGIYLKHFWSFQHL